MLPWAGRLMTLVMLAVLGWLGADIYWSLSAPESSRPSAQMETDLTRVQQALTARHLFGVYVVASAAAVAPSDIRLSGAIAADQDKPGQRGYALLSIEGKPAQLVKEGEELAPGIRLERVAARQVELLRGGQRVTLDLPESAKSGQAKSATAGAAASAAANPAALAAPPPAPAVQPAIIANPNPTPSRRRTRRNPEDDT